MKTLVAVVCLTALTGCGLLTPDPDAKVRDRVTDYLRHFNDDPPWPFEVIHFGETGPWRQQDENVQTAIRQLDEARRQSRELLLDSANVAREIWRLSGQPAPAAQIQPFRARYQRQRAEARQLRQQQDSLRRFLRHPTRDTLRIGTTIRLVYRSTYFPEQKTGTFVVPRKGPVYKKIGPQEFD